MIWLVLLIVAAIGLVLWLNAPLGFVVHAARSKEIWIRRRRFPMAGLYRDSSGNPIDLTGKKIGLVKGDSCLSYGMRDGDIVIASEFDGVNLPTVLKDDLVIINSAKSDDSQPLRFRKIRNVVDNTVDFYDDPTGSLKSKPITDIVARVEMVGSY